MTSMCIELITILLLPPSFLQALLCIISFVLFWCGFEEHLCFLVLSLALGWLNLLYFSRGFRHMGIYSVMIQKVTCHSCNPQKHRCFPLFTTKHVHFTRFKFHLSLFLSRVSLTLTDTSWWYHALPIGLHCLPLWVFSWYLVVVMSFYVKAIEKNINMARLALSKLAWSFIWAFCE